MFNVCETERLAYQGRTVDLLYIACELNDMDIADIEQKTRHRKKYH